MVGLLACAAILAAAIGPVAPRAPEAFASAPTHSRALRSPASWGAARAAPLCERAMRHLLPAPRSRVFMLSSPLPGNPNAGGAGFKRLTGKKRVVDPVKRAQDWEAWLESLTPEERAVVDESERLNPLERHLFNVTQRMQETGCGEFDAEGNFVEGAAGRTTVWDKDIDGRWMLHQCPTSELPANILRRDRFLHAHPGWFRDRPIFESLYLGMVKKAIEEPLSDFEYAELGRLFMRYQHVLTAEPLCDFIEYFLLQRGITLEDLFQITKAIHEVGTVYEFDALGRSKSSGIGDMALEVIRDEYQDEEFDSDPAAGRSTKSKANGLGDTDDTNEDADVMPSADECVEADLPDP